MNITRISGRRTSMAFAKSGPVVSGNVTEDSSKWIGPKSHFDDHRVTGRPCPQYFKVGVFKDQSNEIEYGLIVFDYENGDLRRFTGRIHPESISAPP
jgi:hypothetical protein